jgi:3-oxoadipate enol-lactonase
VSTSEPVDGPGAADAGPPPLPPGRDIELPGRGRTFVRELPGPAGAPTVLLLHGWTATADLNWFASFEALGRRFRVVALDHRGHGRGLRGPRPFRLEDCADDAAALMELCGISRAIPVGYSMGGPIAQLVWRRHPHLVEGMVLCATARSFASTREERLAFLGLSGLAVAARMTPPPAKRWLSELVHARRTREYEEWAAAQVAAHDWQTILEAGSAIGRFSSQGWIGEIDAPTAVLLTMRDRVVPLRRQLRLFESIPGARAYRVDGDHDVCVARPGRFVPTLVAACTWVSERARTAAPGLVT